MVHRIDTKGNIVFWFIVFIVIVIFGIIGSNNKKIHPSPPRLRPELDLDAETTKFVERSIELSEKIAALNAERTVKTIANSSDADFSCPARAVNYHERNLFVKSSDKNRGLTKKVFARSCEKVDSLVLRPEEDGEIGEKTKIFSLVKKRNITRLIHFTRIENLPSILANGLIGRDCMKRSGVAGICNDGFRFDGYTEAVCLSVSFPNYRMLYKYTTMNPDVNYAILSLNPRILWKNECAFYASNAASRRMRAVSMENRMDSESFFEMFSEVGRSELISGAYTTDPQAEILVFNKIAPHDIESISTRRRLSEEDCSNLYCAIRSSGLSLKINVNEEFFYPREDYKQWQSLRAN